MISATLAEKLFRNNEIRVTLAINYKTVFVFLVRVGPIISYLDMAHKIVTADSSKYNLRHANNYQFKISHTRTSIKKNSLSLTSSEIMEPLAFTF